MRLAGEYPVSRPFRRVWLGLRPASTAPPTPSDVVSDFLAPISPLRRPTQQSFQMNPVLWGLPQVPETARWH